MRAQQNRNLYYYCWWEHKCSTSLKSNSGICIMHMKTGHYYLWSVNSTSEKLFWQILILFLYVSSSQSINSMFLKRNWCIRRIQSRLLDHMALNVHSLPSTAPVLPLQWDWALVPRAGLALDCLQPGPHASVLLCGNVRPVSLSGCGGLDWKPAFASSLAWFIS